MWIDPKYDASAHGTILISNILGKRNAFDYPKSLYAVIDSLSVLLREKKDAIVLDFFAGSGTTGHAILEMNKKDNGKRRYILCTNNENNICEEITYERMKNVILGYKDEKNNSIEGLESNLKYYKTSYIPRINSDEENLHNNLLKYIKTLIQLDNSIEIDNKKIKVYLEESEFDKMMEDNKQLEECEKIYVSSDILLTQQQEKLIEDNNIELYIIPEYYFKDEIMEVNE